MPTDLAAAFELSATDKPPAITEPMPRLAGGTHAHTHTVHSALVSLRALRVPPARIRLRRAGRQGSPAGTVVSQSPAPGEPITNATLVELDIAGLGFTQALPVGMWDSGGESAMGTREILEPLDDPLEKLAHWFHEGAPLFRLAPDDLPACARWLTLFGLHPEEWPNSLWYRLASLVSSLSTLACSQAGCAFVLKALLNLPVARFRYVPCTARLHADAVSHLGAGLSRLGVDVVMGDQVEDFATLEITLGPVPLEVYERFAESAEGAGLLRRVLLLSLPASTQFAVQWSVGDRNLPPQLGIPAQNSRLGINTHMGAAPGINQTPTPPVSVWSPA